MARGSAAALAASLEGAEAAADPDDTTVARILSWNLEALFRRAAGKRKEAVELARRAAEAEAARPLEYGPPSVVKPSHELLGELLLELGRPAEAHEQFEEALERAPRRTQSLRGLAQAARAAGDEAAAREAERTLGQIWQGS